ncbi:MAG: hypothetical protein KDJ80_02935 [Nitratireductor sp.]|nr:hypothetical protein [Nitratireductor sp.]
MPTMEVKGAEIRLPLIDEAEQIAAEYRKSDEEMAREYALMMEAIYLDTSELDPQLCAPDRRLYRGDREAWVYEHGNIAELVFVR